MIDLLDADKFYFWLEAHDPEDIVGYVGEPNYCPISTYLRDFEVEAVVAPSETLVDCVTVKNPYWVDRFIYHVDSLDVEEDGITAERARVCMNIVRSEVMHQETQARMALDEAKAEC